MRKIYKYFNLNLSLILTDLYVLLFLFFYVLNAARPIRFWKSTANRPHFRRSDLHDWWWFITATWTAHLFLLLFHFGSPISVAHRACVFFLIYLIFVCCAYVCFVRVYSCAAARADCHTRLRKHQRLSHYRRRNSRRWGEVCRISTRRPDGHVQFAGKWREFRIVFGSLSYLVMRFFFV